MIEATIQGGRLYWPGRPEPAPARAGVGQGGGLTTFRNFLVLLTVSLYLIFNWGFQQVRIPPVAGGGLPVGEIVLFLYLLAINYTGVLGRLSLTVAILPLGIWWTFGVGRALFDFSQHGTWALRDAAHVLESLFLLVGFVFAGDPKRLERFFVWLPRLLLLAVLYGSLYQIRTLLWDLSPKITAGAGHEAPIFGSMANTALLMLMAAVALILFRGNRLLANVVAVLIICYTLAAFQARTLYLILIAVFGFLMLYRQSIIGHLGIIAGAALFLLAVITLVGLQFEGRLGAAISSEFLISHFLAIFGICDSSAHENVCAAADGLGQRLEWWASIFQRMALDPVSLLFGLGYGIPLTDFHSDTGAVVREPHNSYITVIARTGIVGAICWVLVMVSMVLRWHKSFVECHRLGWRVGENRLLVMMVFFISCWVLAIGEDGFEKPYNIIPFYFFWGVVLRFSLLLERGQIGPAAQAEAN